MAVELLVDGLKLLFPAGTASRILALLRQDDLVWAAFADEGFAQKALEVCASQVNAWSPGVLALVALDEQQIANHLTAEPMQPLESGLRQRAVRAYEDSRKKGSGPTDLREAGLLGLALRERRRYTGSWIGLPAELLTAPSGVKAIPPRTWKTALACLVGYIPNSLELMEALVESGMDAAWLEWILHIVVTQPDEGGEQVGRIEQLLREKPVDLQLKFLKSLRSKGCTALVQKTANALLAGHPAFMGLSTKTGIDDLSLSELSNRVILLQQMASLQQLAGAPVQADATLKNAQAVLNYWQSGLKLQSFGLNGELADENDIVKVLHEITETGVSAKRLQSQAGTVISRKNIISDDDLTALASPEDPQLLLMKAERLYKQGKRSLAVEIAHKAAGDLVNELNENPLYPDGEFGVAVSTERMAGILSAMNMVEEAVDMVETALETSPADVELVDLASQLQTKLGNLKRAKELAIFLTGLKHDYLANFRRLSGLCEQLADWQQAFKYRKAVLELDPEHGMEDKVNYARAALNSGLDDEAATTCENILAESPDEGSIHGILGLTRAKQGRDEDAVLHLNRATLLSPEDAEWWLALAEQQKKMGDTRTAVEILRAGVLAAPDSGAIHFTLGELLLQGGMNAEALPHLKHAASLAPEDEKIAFRLGKALRSMGYLADARRVIDRIEPKWSAHPEIAYEYGQIALSLGDIDASIPAFDAAARSEKAQPEWLAAYADLLLDDSVRSSKLDESSRYLQAEGFLARSLEIQPKNLKTQITLAHALRKQGKFDEAYSLYQTLVEMPEVVEQDQLWSVQHGFGLTALAMHQVEPGIALLREAAQKKTDYLVLQQDLANACLAANLYQDAAEVAERALEIAPDDHANLDWFANVMVNLGRADRAAEALRCAIDLTPDRLDLRVRYAQLAMENGQIQDAQDALRKLPELDGFDPQILRQAAYLHLRMQEPDEAIENLEKAVMLSDNPPADLLYDLAVVYSQNERIDDAIQAIQQATDSCRDIQMHVFHADLLARQKRYQAALLAVDRALKLTQSDDPCNVEQLPKIHERSARWNRELGNVASAFEQAEKALDFDPEDFELRFMAADLALAMLQSGKASKYTLLPFEAANRTDMDQKGLHLACLSAHLALENGRMDDAQGLYDVCKQIAPDDEWVKTIGARLMAQKGDILAASIEMDPYFNAISNDDIHPGDNTLWAAKTAHETYTWDVCFRLYDTFISKYSTEHRGSYELAKTLVEAAETQRLCDELDIQTHAPGIDVHDDNFIQRFEEILESVRPLLNPEEADHWQNRAKLVFNPSLDSMRDFNGTTCSAMDIAAVMASLRSIKSFQTAIQIGQTYADAPEVKMQKAFIQAETEPKAALETAEAVLSEVPEHPIFISAYATLAVKAGQDEQAYEAIEKALTIWPDEPKWHRLAGELAMRLNDIKTSIIHWKEALALQPGNIDYTIALGKAFYLDGDYPLAVDVLMKAINLDDSHSEAWLALAYAQHSLDKVEEAIASAVKSSELDQKSPRGLVLASQICQSIGLTEKAVEFARAGMSRDPKDPKAIVNLSQVLNQQGKLLESLEVIEQSIDLMEPEKDLLIERARLIHQASGAAASVELVNQLVEQYPEEAEILALHATVQAELGDMKAAERSAFRSLRLQPNQPGLAIALGRMTRKAGQLDQAVHLLSQAITMNPDSVDAYLELGQAYIDRREYQQALQSFRHAMRVSPRDPRGYYQAALIMKETKDYPGAETMLEQAARFAPEDLQIHRQLVGVMALNLIHKSQEANRAL